MNGLVPSGASTQLQAWAKVATEALSQSTLDAYRNDSRVFADWAAERGANTLPASPETVAAFLQDEATRWATATVKRRAATISQMHRAAELPNPCQSQLVRLTLKGIGKKHGTDQKQAAPITERDSLTIRARLSDSLRDCRNLALMLVGRDLLARASELVGLEVSAVEWDEDGATVAMRRKKTKTEASVYFIGSEAAEALREWLRRSEITEGPIFRSLTKGGKVKDSVLTRRDVQNILKEMAVSARLEHGEAVSGHSLRVGMAQDLVAADMDLASIMQAGGWSSPDMVAKYSAKLSARRGAIARYYQRRA